MRSQFLRVPWNFEVFHDFFGPGPRDEITALNSLTILVSGMKLCEMMQSNWILRYKMAMLG